MNRNSELLEAMLNAQEKERERLAMELHDGLGAKISALSLETEILTSMLSKEHHKKSIYIHSLIEEVRQDVRTISRDLVPRDLLRSGLSYELDKLQFTIEDLYKMKFQLTLTGMEQKMPYTTELNIFRIVQELINNTIKHAKADLIQLIITKNNEQLSISYKDNGSGFDENKHSDGIGINNIKTRVAHLHSESHIQLSSHSGFEISIFVPLNPN